MIRCITLATLEERMAYQYKALKPLEIFLPKRWIKQGVSERKHRAYMQVKAPQICFINRWYFPGNARRWALNLIDHYQLQLLQ